MRLDSHRYALVRSRFALTLVLLSSLLLSACEGGRGGMSFVGDDLIPASPRALPESHIRAGVGSADTTWHVGVSAGQYSDFNTGLLEGLLLQGPIDPSLHSVTKQRSDGVQSRLTARALVIEGEDGQRIALLKTDNYLAQDLLLRRVAQLLDEGSSGVSYDNILHAVTHNHSSPYNSSLAVGTWVFQDAFDQRMFESQARAIRDAIEQAATNLRPARLGATSVSMIIEGVPFKGNIAGRGPGFDGTPTGYPADFGDHDMVVMRVDAVDGDSAEPLAVWINYGQHPESLDGYGLTSADFLGPLERFVERDLGVPLIYSQGDVGSAEGPYDRGGHVWSDGTTRAWAHSGWAQAERGARLLADGVICGWQRIASEQDPRLHPDSPFVCDLSQAADVPFQYAPPIAAYSTWIPGPLSHPVPTVSNCNTGETVDGNPGVPVAGLPDCERLGEVEPLSPVLNAFDLHQLPLPDHYAGPGFPAVEENLRLRLQAFRLGDIVLGSCACEAQVDLILNFESRADQQPGNRYDGFDWTCLVAPDDPACVAQNNIAWGDARPDIAGSLDDPEQVAHMRAQIHNDATGWDEPANALAANREPDDDQAIWGNFSHQEIQDLGYEGYKLAIGVGHAGDYNGYTVSYREYMARDSYRKALTSYGPHTADYMVTRLVHMAAALQGGPALEAEPTALIQVVDEVRQSTEAQIVGLESGLSFDLYQSLIPNDAGNAEILAQPQDTTRFNATTVSWRGGSNAVDNPLVTVEREVAPDQWQRYADMSGEVQTLLEFPEGVAGVLQATGGLHEWIWHANFEAFTASPARLGQTPTGRYRFHVQGRHKPGMDIADYELTSEPFQVTPWSGIAVADLRTEAGGVSFAIAPVEYPRSYASIFGVIADDGNEDNPESNNLCHACSFRPWARHSVVAQAQVHVVDAGGAQRIISATAQNDRWYAAVGNLPAGTQVEIRPGDILDANGETNGETVSLR